MLDIKLGLGDKRTITKKLKGYKERRLRSLV